MSTVKRFTVLPNDDEPLAFEFVDTEEPPNVLGGGPFRVTRRPRLDIALGMSQAVTLQNGKREVDQSTLLWVLRELMVLEVRDVETGVWAPADDRERFEAMLSSDRHKINWTVLGEVVQWLTEELSGHPTGASSRS